MTCIESYESVHTDNEKIYLVAGEIKDAQSDASVGLYAFRRTSRPAILRPVCSSSLPQTHLAASLTATLARQCITQ